MAKFIKKDFEEWLNKQPEDRDFNVDDNYKCLFASFLMETNQNCVSVGVEAYTVLKDGVRYSEKCPKWSVRIQRELFALPRGVNVKKIREIYINLNYI